jgi:hypothetical protein
MGEGCVCAECGVWNVRAGGETMYRRKEEGGGGGGGGERCTERSGGTDIILSCGVR